MAIGNRADESCQLRHWNHAAMGLGLDTGKMRLQNFAIHGSRHGRGRVRCRRKQRDHFTRRKWFSRTNAGRLGRSTQQFDPQRGATENVRVAWTRTHRKRLFVGELCPRLREVVTRSSAHSGRIAGFHRTPQFWTLEPKQSRAGTFRWRRNRYLSAEKWTHLGAHFSLRLFLQTHRQTVHASP